MRFIHLGDLHIGKSLGEYNLIEDQQYILDQILELIKDRDIDAALLAGDIYDRALPSEAAVSLLDYFISRLAENGIETYIISGNHDSEDRLNYGRKLFSSKGIHIVSRFGGALEKYELEDEFGKISICLLPFVKASQVRHFYPEEEINSYDDAVRAVIDHADIDFDSRNILIAHQFVTGETDPAIAGSEGGSVQNVGTIEKISCESLKAFDYVALGHLHSPQRIGYDNIRYSGSILKYSLSEAGSSKSVPVITLKEKGNMDIELVPLRPKRDLRHITGKMEQLLASENITDTDDFMYVTLTNEEIINDAMNIIQQYYPNTVKIDYQNSHTKEIEELGVFEATENKSFDELISDFYKKMYGTDITDEELRIMMEVAREAGVIHEAD
ncbi:MAG: exonuclease SbcCD subunit D [Mogibacterium sp.]|nr:exonuclease SbcCD subunit D [Mogibacterium sp.]